MQFTTLFIAHIQPMTVFGASLTLVVRIGIGHWRSELVNPVPRTYVLSKEFGTFIPGLTIGAFCRSG